MPTINSRIICASIVICLICSWQARKYKWVGEISFAMELIDAAYYTEVDREELYSSAMKGMISSLDPYSGFIERKSLPQFQRSISQEFGGLGIFIEGPPTFDELRIISPVYGSPAWESGLLPGDVIVSVEGNDIRGVETDIVSEKLQGPKGSTVNIQVKRLGVENLLDFTIRRDTIQLESITGTRRRTDGRWEYFFEEHPGVAYIRLSTFGEKSVNELRTTLNEIRGDAKGLILDLRSNSGGLLDSAVKICDMFLDGGPIVSVKGRYEFSNEQFSANPGTLLPNDVPMVVLINGDSASASEIVSACLEDRERATVVGVRSFGKGSVQTVVDLDSGKTAMRLTTARYFPPSGRVIHRDQDAKDEDQWGVTPRPENVVELTPRQNVEVIASMRLRGDPNADQRVAEFFQMIDLDRLAAESVENESNDADSTDVVAVDSDESSRPESVESATNEDNSSATPIPASGEESASKENSVEDNQPEVEDRESRDEINDPTTSEIPQTMADLHDPQLDRAIEVIEEQLR